MADLTITAANVAVKDATLTQMSLVTYGETVTQGMPVYLNTGDGEYYKADADNTATTATVAGVAVTPGGDGEPGLICTEGPLDVGATLTVGEIYVLSGTAGGIAPEADLASLDYVSILGVATAADTLTINLINSGVQIP